MSDPHLIQTVAGALERAVPEYAVGEPCLNPDEFWDGKAGIDATDARDMARALLADLEAAGFQVVRATVTAEKDA